MFKSDAYGTSDSNFINGNIKKSWADVKKALKEEEDFLTGMFGAGGKKFKGDSSHSMVQIKNVPDYFCDVFCASLDIDEVLEGIMQDESKDKKMVMKNTTHFYSPLADEQTMLNQNNEAAGTNPYDQLTTYKL